MVGFKKPGSAIGRLSNAATPSGGGGRVTGATRVLEASTGSGTWAVPATGVYRIIVVGAGGSGGQGPGDTYTGGGGGGYCEATRTLNAGDTFAYVVGAGPAINTSGVGSGGGQSRFYTDSSSVSLNILANGGSGGNNAVSVAGGTASGGDLNQSGNPSGRTAVSTLYPPGGAAGSPFKFSSSMVGGGGDGALGAGVNGSSGSNYGDGGGCGGDGGGAGRSGFVAVYRMLT